VGDLPVNQLQIGFIVHGSLHPDQKGRYFRQPVCLRQPSIFHSARRVNFSEYVGLIQN
jgi:hypothetical protein